METTGFCQVKQTVNKIKIIGYISIDLNKYPIFLNDDNSYTSEFIHNNKKLVLNIPFKYKYLINKMIKNGIELNIEVFSEYIYINKVMVENDGIVYKM